MYLHVHAMQLFNEGNYWDSLPHEVTVYNGSYTLIVKDYAWYCQKSDQNFNQFLHSIM